MEPLLSENVRKRILAEVTPTQSEIDLQKNVIDTLKRALYDHQNSGRYSFSFIEAQGSTGRKQTQLKDSADIDLFVGLKPEEYGDILQKSTNERHDKLHKLMNSLVTDWFEPALKGLDVKNVQKAFSQHPYLSLKMKNLDVDILGCFDIDSATLAEEGPITAVDRTVHHTNFIADRLTDEKRDDARILKSFVKACHAYGDSCAVGRMGITGVSLELIAIFSKSLDAGLNALERLSEKPIDPLNRPLDELRKNPAFRDDYIILIDPTDHQRNIASSFTPRAYEWVRYNIRRLYKASQSDVEDRLFELLLESPIPTVELPAWVRSHAFTREFLSDESRHYTILRDKLHRVAKKIQASLQTERTGEPRFGETLVEVYFEDKRYSIGILVENPNASETFVRKGPPVGLKEAGEEFRKKHPNIEEKDGFLWTIENREWNDVNPLINMVLENNPVQGLVQTLVSTEVSQKVLNVLYRYVLPIETSLLKKITKDKEGTHEIPW
ncbi:MAG: hypothetical protein ACFFFK_05520 [Candidatus Thorarchaeota archaeon]